MRLKHHVSAIALAGVMAGAAPVIAVAQEQQSTPPMEELTVEEVDAFVIAYNGIQGIDEDFSAQIAQTTDEAELQGLLEESQMKKAEVVEATPGIDVDRYIEILTLAQTDPNVREQIVAKLEQ